ncbi:Rpn family recombination-promoting nuclease/putative transposase [Pedobacter sp. JY14-1]|uniref:Rpn family recombination-promoting nuclease/putative transposase n=1 Tax=Pedobacter sp. JY14-1 TaxID=3034151 RepID=UPI0023E12CD0|nr:Rpn family recombination-promoting nuclease/putative transposase [Pedobacter sp. JY14-1]
MKGCWSLKRNGAKYPLSSVVFDVLCTTNNGEKILIEVQHSRPINFKKRGIYYISRLISEQAPKGKMSEWQYDISEVYFIAILDKPEPPVTKNKLTSKERYVHDVCLCYRETGEIFYDDLGYIYIDLTNFAKTDEECNIPLDRWLYELKHMPERDDCPPHLTDTIFGKLYSVGEYANLNREEQKMYDQELKRKWDNAAVLSQAKLEGEAIGKLNGKLEIAEKLKRKGIDIAEIAELTGLSIEEVEKRQSAT